MGTWSYNKIRNNLINWLIHEPPPDEVPPCDFNRLKHEIRSGDVLLIEGRSRISHIIRSITQSPWTHAALYIGRLSDIENEELADFIRKHVDEKENTRLIAESLIDKGTIIAPLSSYRHHHIRICRPIGIAPDDVEEAFSSIHFPILPFVKSTHDTEVELIPRNPYLFTPKDFDYSPYFEIIKYPLFNPEEPPPYYRRLPWNKGGLVHHDHGIITERGKKKKMPKDETPADDNDNPEISF